MTRQIVLLGHDNPFAPDIARRLAQDDANVATSLEGDSALDGLVIVMPPPHLETSFLDVTDAQLEAGLAEFLDLFAALGRALPRLRDGGSLVVISHRGHLGAWNGAHEMAFAGAVAGLMRSVSLENATRDIRANVIAIELPDASETSDPIEVASLAAFLLSPAAGGVNGELILANRGRSLQIREARDRRPSPHKPS